MLNNLTRAKDCESFSICPENLTGERGNGGRCPLGEGVATNAARDLGIGWKVNPLIVIPAGETAVLASVKGQGAIKHIWITDSARAGRQLILRIYFDGAKRPSIEVPLSDFFLNADYREFKQISSLPFCFNPGKAMNCYLEMPYRTGFRIELQNLGERCDVYYQIDCEKKTLPSDSLYLHAQFRRINPLPYKQPYVIVDGIKGRGHYVGTYIHWGVKSNGWWGEGEIKFFIDGDGEFPTICGTGTEDYFCGAYNFDVGGKYVPYSTPYAGFFPCSTDETYKAQRYFDMYRFHITDPVYFSKDLKVTIQALGWRSGGRYLPLTDDISSVAYWYSDSLEDEYPPLPSHDELEIV